VKDQGIWPQPYRDKRDAPDLVALGNSQLDFLDIHFYRARKTIDLTDCFRSNMKSSLVDSPEMSHILQSKPVILGEFGAFRFVESDMAEVVPNMLKICDLARNEGLKGFMFWTYDTAEQPTLFHATEGAEVLLNALGKEAE
jgi:hypothetical protein